MTVDCMGMNELISHKTTPVTINTITIVSSDIILIFKVLPKAIMLKRFYAKVKNMMQCMCYIVIDKIYIIHTF